MQDAHAAVRSLFNSDLLGPDVVLDLVELPVM
jgi:hypothetical protein